MACLGDGEGLTQGGGGGTSTSVRDIFTHDESQRMHNSLINMVDTKKEHHADHI